MVAGTERMKSARSELLLAGLLLVAGPVLADVDQEPRVPGSGPAPGQGAAAAAIPSVSVRGPLTLIAQSEYIEDSNGDRFVDPSVFVAYRQTHAQLWAGEFTRGVQLGGFLRDSRRSTYGAFYRFRDDFDHVLDFSTEQVAGAGFVAYAGLRYIRVIDDDIADRNLWQPSVGFDKYYGGYSFFSLRAVHDPRESDRYSVVLANRFALADRFLTLGLVPRTDGDLGYFVQGRWRWLRAGVGRFDQFDFTDVDRTVFHVGFEFGF